MFQLVSMTSESDQRIRREMWSDDMIIIAISYRYQVIAICSYLMMVRSYECVILFPCTIVVGCRCDDRLGPVQCERCSWCLAGQSSGVSDGCAIGRLHRCPWACLWQGSCHLRQIDSHCRLSSECIPGTFHRPSGPSSVCGSCCEDHRIRWTNSVLHWLRIRSLRSLVRFPFLVKNKDQSLISVNLNQIGQHHL